MKQLGRNQSFWKGLISANWPFLYLIVKSTFLGPLKLVIHPIFTKFRHLLKLIFLICGATIVPHNPYRSLKASTVLSSSNSPSIDSVCVWWAFRVTMQPSTLLTIWASYYELLSTNLILWAFIRRSFFPVFCTFNFSFEDSSQVTDDLFKLFGSFIKFINAINSIKLWSKKHQRFKRLEISYRSVAFCCWTIEAAANSSPNFQVSRTIRMALAP